LNWDSQVADFLINFHIHEVVGIDLGKDTQFDADVSILNGTLRQRLPGGGRYDLGTCYRNVIGNGDIRLLVVRSDQNRELNMEPVLDEFSRIELFGDDSKLRKVIILNRNTGSQSQAPTVTPTPSGNPKKRVSRSVSTPKPTARSATIPLPETNLSKEQLQTLIRGAYRSPLPEKLWDDPEYQEFLMSQGITSREEMKDRNKAKNVRKTVRRMLWQLKNKS
jgi:hypothetical protein